MSRDEEQYQKVHPLLEAAVRDLRRRLKDTLNKLGDPYLVRMRPIEWRIKEFSSLERKAKQRGWTMAKALENTTDLVGFRVVCNNLQDVERAADFLRESLTTEGITITQANYIGTPQQGGYRAIHLDIRLPVRMRNQKMTVGCEVQIRSFLQDAWARLSHEDIYKSSSRLPPLLRRSMERLSELLLVADQIANDIREEISRPRRGQPPGQGAKLTREAVAFLFRREFGAGAPDYLVEATIRNYGNASIRSDGLETALRDAELRGQLQAAYAEHSPWNPEPEELFRWVVHAAAYGTKAAIRLARREGRIHWSEIDGAYRSVLLSELPNTWEEFIRLGDDKDSDPSYDFPRWAAVFGALERCSICGTDIVDTYTFAEALVEHYGLEGDEAEEAREAIESAIMHSGVEVGDWQNSSLCGYHGDVMKRED